MHLEQLRADLDSALESLLYATNNYGVGNESISPKTFIELLNKLTVRSKAVLTYLTEHDPVEVVESKTNDYDLGNSSKVVNWIDMGKTRGFKAEGCSVSNADLSEFLLTLTDDMLNCQTALVAANALFSDYIANPSALNKFTGDSIPKLDRVKDTLKEFGNYFNGKEGLDRNLLSELYPSYRGFHVVSSQLVKLTSKFNAVRTHDLKSKMDDLDETLDILIKTIRDNQIGKDAAQRIGVTVYNLADWTALYSMYLAKLVSLERAHRDNVGVITERATD